MIVNPSAEAVAFKYDGTIGEAVYAFSGTVKAENGNVKVPGQSFGYYRI